jgi:hypothetical protein
MKKPWVRHARSAARHGLSNAATIVHTTDMRSCVLYHSFCCDDRVVGHRICGRTQEQWPACMLRNVRTRSETRPDRDWLVPNFHSNQWGRKRIYGCKYPCCDCWIIPLILPRSECPVADTPDNAIAWTHSIVCQRCILMRQGCQNQKCYNCKEDSRWLTRCAEDMSHSGTSMPTRDWYGMDLQPQ